MTETGNRRALHWNRIRGPRESVALWFATAGGAGLLPLAPGTWGTLVGIPLAWMTAEAPLLFRVVFWLLLFIVAVWSAAVVDDTMGTQDNQNIVIDEVIGYGITAWTCGRNWELLLIAFAVFRIFDMIKIPPVRQIDEWSHVQASSISDPRAKWRAKWITGFGVIADDAGAGFQGLLVMWLIQNFVARYADL